jgi:hypothetical protein
MVLRQPGEIQDTVLDGVRLSCLSRTSLGKLEPMGSAQAGSGWTGYGRSEPRAARREQALSQVTPNPRAGGRGTV